MWQFYDRLVNITLPRVRDFKGISDKAFDGHGNYSLGIREQIVFPEIDYDSVDAVRGMNITIVTDTDDDDHARSLLLQPGTARAVGLDVDVLLGPPQRHRARAFGGQRGPNEVT